MVEPKVVLTVIDSFRWPAMRVGTPFVSFSVTPTAEPEVPALVAEVAERAIAVGTPPMEMVARRTGSPTELLLPLLRFTSKPDASTQISTT